MQIISLHKMKGTLACAGEQTAIKNSSYNSYNEYKKLEILLLEIGT